MRVGRIPYVNCYPVYGAIDRAIVPLNGTIVTGVPSALNRRMADGTLDISVVSAVEYARDARRYLLLPDLAISCDGPVRSVMLFSKRPAGELDGRRVIVSRSSMTSVALVELLFENVWNARPDFVAGDAEMSDIAGFDRDVHDARLVIGDAALVLRGESRPHVADSSQASELPSYPYAYDLGETAKVAILSVPEGDDKPLKYPGLFQRADLMVVSKIDLLGTSDFDADRAEANAREVAPHIEVVRLSSRTGEGLEGWTAWLASRLARTAPLMAHPA